MTLEATRRQLLLGEEDELATAELLALLLGSGQAARQVLARFETLGSLEERTVQELLEVPEVGPLRAARVRAALALGRRRRAEPPWRGRSISSSDDVDRLLSPLLCHERREVMVVLALDARNRLIRSPIIASIGSLTSAVVEPRELLRPLLIAAAASAVLAHNHPSTTPEPSPEDVALSRVMFEACALVGIRLLDHVIIGDGAYTSLADQGLI